jgi:hypothetical protein
MPQISHQPEPFPFGTRENRAKTVHFAELAAGRTTKQIVYIRTISVLAIHTEKALGNA